MKKSPSPHLSPENFTMEAQPPKVSKGSGTLPPPVAASGRVKEASETSNASGSAAVRRLIWPD